MRHVETSLRNKDRKFIDSDCDDEEGTEHLHQLTTTASLEFTLQYHRISLVRPIADEMRLLVDFLDGMLRDIAAYVPIQEGEMNSSKAR